MLFHTLPGGREVEAGRREGGRGWAGRGARLMAGKADGPVARGEGRAGQWEPARPSWCLQCLGQQGEDIAVGDAGDSVVGVCDGCGDAVEADGSILVCFRFDDEYWECCESRGGRC